MVFEYASYFSLLFFPPFLLSLFRGCHSTGSNNLYHTRALHTHQCIILPSASIVCIIMTYQSGTDTHTALHYQWCCFETSFFGHFIWRFFCFFVFFLLALRRMRLNKVIRCVSQGFWTCLFCCLVSRTNTTKPQLQLSSSINKQPVYSLSLLASILEPG